MTLDEKKKKRRKKKPYDSKTYTTGCPMLNDYFFNKINGTLGNDTTADDTDVSDSADIGGGESTGEGGAMGESLNLKESWKDFDYRDYSDDEIVTVVITDKRFEPLFKKEQKEVLNRNNVRVESVRFNGVIVTGKVGDIIQVCNDCGVMTPREIFIESLTEAMSYTTIKRLLDEIWANRSGVEGVIAKLDTTGNVGPDIAKWAGTKAAKLIHIDGSAEYNLDQEMPDTDGDAYESGAEKDTLNSRLKEAKTIVLISNFIKASASTKKQLLKLFIRKNIQMIIMTGTELELRRIPQDMKAKFNHEISFIEKDNKEPAQAATVDNPVYDHAGAEPVNANESLTEAKREVRRYFIRPQNIFCANKAEIIKALIDIGDQNCSVYTLKYLGPEKDINKLTNKDIIYYYDDEILYDKNHVKVMDYDLYIKHEEERQKFSGDIEDVPEEKFNDEYEDRIHQDTVLEDTDMPLDLDFTLTEDRQKYVCCICGEPSEGYGNNPNPYKDAGRCCDACNLKFVIPARLTQYRDEYSWPGLDDYFDEVDK